MNKQTKSIFAIPIQSLSGTIFFVRFNTDQEKEARVLASCISSRAPNLLTILTEDEPED